MSAQSAVVTVAPLDCRGACFKLHAGHAIFAADPASSDANLHAAPNSHANFDPDLNSDAHANPNANSLAGGGIHP